VGHGQGVEGAGFGAVGDGPIEGPGDDYLEALRRWLARYKQYPDDAVKKKQEGRVEIGFVLDRDGTVLDAWIERSSGVPELDQATLAMLHRASPVPPVPQRYKGKQLKLVMPIDYSIGLFDKLFR
jgi:protein TonB